MRESKSSWLTVFCIVLLLPACNSITATQTDSFSDIQTTIFDKSCAIRGCHTGTQPAALLDLEAGASYAYLLEHRIENDTARKYFKARVAPGQTDSSFLMAKITGVLTRDEGVQMPQSLSPLNQEQLDEIRRWIANGAKNN